MSRYKVTSQHEVYHDTYADGELEHVNSYTSTDTLDRPDPQEAIADYVEHFLGYRDFKLDLTDDHTASWSQLVDAENSELSEQERTNWIKGVFKAYTNSFTITVEELVLCKLNT